MDVCVLIAVYATIKGYDYTNIICKTEQTNPSQKFSILKRIQVKPITTKMYDVILLCSKMSTTANVF